MVKKIAFVSDFDGTITPEDFFWYVSEQYLDEQALKPWQLYLEGRETHLNALNRIFGQIRVPQEQFDAFIKKIPYDKMFPNVAALCLKKQIPFYICSAGCDYYIKRIIGEYLKEYNIQLVTNHGVYSEQDGLKMLPPPEESPFYNAEVGISKAAVVQKLKDEGCFVVFAGDGPPDAAPAALADVVFAKKMLLKLCSEQQIPCLEFNGFDEIFNYLKER